MERRTALVTGASSGIGAAFAEVFAARGFDVVVTARREARLRTLASLLEERYNVKVHVLPEDLRDPAATDRLCSEVARRGLTIDALVNNAGYGVPGLYASTSWQQQSEFLQVLGRSVAELTHRLFPDMLDRRYGRIINVSSLAGLLPAPAGHTLYAAVKAFVIRFSEALSHEGKHHGVHVTAVCPGFTLSEFHDLTRTRDKVSRLPKFMWMDAASVARGGVDAVMRGQTLYIPGRVNRLIATFGRHLPYGLVYWLMRRFAWSYRKN